MSLDTGLLPPSESQARSGPAPPPPSGDTQATSRKGPREHGSWRAALARIAPPAVRRLAAKAGAVAAVSGTLYGTVAGLLAAASSPDRSSRQVTMILAVAFGFLIIVFGLVLSAASSVWLIGRITPRTFDNITRLRSVLSWNRPSSDPGTRLSSDR
jgi:hypothetical protein